MKKKFFVFAGKSYRCKSLREHMKDFNHTHIDILKADVEGMEWNLTKYEDFSSLQIGQILMEFHFINKLMKVDDAKRLTDLREHIIPMEKAGFFIMSIEPVNANGKQYELVFLNVNWSPAGFNNKIFDARMYPSTPGVDL